eukprot:SAG11_NODE_18399_length_492_cov_0.903308_1_plen_22_part_10
MLEELMARHSAQRHLCHLIAHV